jgi:hypothetical protein
LEELASIEEYKAQEQIQFDIDLGKTVLEWRKQRLQKQENERPTLIVFPTLRHIHKVREEGRHAERMLY